MKKHRPRLLWITNVASPYRIPVWRKLTEYVDLLVAFHGRQQANRPEWRVPEGQPFANTYFRTLMSKNGSDSRLTGLIAPGELDRVRRWDPAAVVMTAWGDTASVQAGLHVHRLRRFPLIAYYGSSRSTRSTSRFVAAARRRYLRRFSAFVTYGTESTDLLVEDAVPPSTIITGFNSVDVQALHDSASIHRAAASISTASPEPHRFLFVGQLIARKGPDLAVIAMADPRLSRCTLTVVGSGPMSERLRATAHQLNVEDRVRFVGVRDAVTMPAEYAGHHTLVMPSRAEVWGLVANEALACGLHAVVSTSAGCARDIRDHRGVFLASPTVEALADSMAASARRWEGFIRDPAILRDGADRMASDVWAAMAMALDDPRCPSEAT